MRWILAVCIILFFAAVLLLRKELSKPSSRPAFLGDRTEFVVAASAPMVAPPWRCHVLDDLDRGVHLYDGFVTDDEKEKILCERNHGDGSIYKFTNGTDAFAPGCGGCTCCVAQKQWRCHAWTQDEKMQPNFRDRQLQLQTCERNRGDGSVYKFTGGSNELVPGCADGCWCCKKGYVIPECPYVDVPAPPYIDVGPESRQSLSHVVWNQYYEKAQEAKCIKFQGDIGYWPDVYTYDSWHNYLPTVVEVLKSFVGPQNPEVLTLMEQGDIYLFGVAQGESMKYMHEMFNGHRLFGFDSFKGLPKEAEKMMKAGNWAEGAYPPAASPEDVEKYAGGSGVARVIPGFFNESLHPGIVEKEGMRPAFYVDIDCDLYASTMPALEFLFATNIIRVGTLVGYDDWWTVPCRKYNSPHEETCATSPMKVGEGLAHSHITAKYGVRFRCVAGPCRPQPKSFNYRNQCDLHNAFGPVFIVESIGNHETADTGFEFNSAQEKYWLEYFTFCNTC